MFLNCSMKRWQEKDKRLQRRGKRWRKWLKWVTGSKWCTVEDEEVKQVGGSEADRQTGREWKEGGKRARLCGEKRTILINISLWKNWEHMGRKRGVEGRERAHVNRHGCLQTIDYIHVSGHLMSPAAHQKVFHFVCPAVGPGQVTSACFWGFFFFVLAGNSCQMLL